MLSSVLFLCYYLATNWVVDSAGGLQVPEVNTNLEVRIILTWYTKWISNHNYWSFQKILNKGFIGTSHCLGFGLIWTFQSFSLHQWIVTENLALLGVDSAINTRVHSLNVGRFSTCFLPVPTYLQWDCHSCVWKPFPKKDKRVKTVPTEITFVGESNIKENTCTSISFKAKVKPSGVT